MGEVIVRLKGGLGNQLFQYASAYSFCKKHNLDLKFDLSFYNESRYNDIYRLQYYDLEIDEISNKEKELLKSYLKNKKSQKRVLKVLNIFKKDNDLFKVVKASSLKSIMTREIHDTCYLFDDWFVNPDFFKNYRGELTRMFTPIHLSDESKQVLKNIQTCNSISVHVRRGDYVGNPYFNNLNESYYLPAIKKMQESVKDVVFYFFSNDTDYVVNTFKDVTNKVIVSINSTQLNKYSTKGDVEDLYLMANCKGQIIANSTFSWWGAFLNDNPNPKIIAPVKWYNDKNAQKSYANSSLILSNWSKI